MSEAARAVLALRDVAKTWAAGDRRFTLTVDDFAVDGGEVVVVTGESGSGKSTLLELAGLATAPDSAAGFMLADGDTTTDVAELHERRDGKALAHLRARTIGYVLQNGGLLPFLDVESNIALPQTLAERPDPAIIDWLLGRLGLYGASKAYPKALSAGQRQRVAIARALAHRPALVLADEPTAALDPPNKARVVDLFLTLADELHAAVVIATHEREVFEGRAVRRAVIRAHPVATPDGEHVEATFERLAA